MPPRLHTGGRWRAWLGRHLGGGPELGDRAWRRILHGAGAFVLLYYLVPGGAFVVLPTWALLLAVLAVVLALELLRHAVGLELPTIRPYESGRVASFTYFAVGLVVAVLLFPRPIAVVVVLGTSFVDPLSGELRLRGVRPLVGFGGPVVAYALVALVALRLAGPWPWAGCLLAAPIAAIAAVLAERPRHRYYDDDLAMTLVPALLLAALAAWLPGLT